jgi:serine/threonine protein kinase
MSWKLGDELGVGSFGRVFRATSPTGKQAAVKILPVTTTRQRRLAIHEGHVQSRLSHPNIVRLIESIDHGDTHWLVCELIDGGDLSSWLAVRTRDEHEILSLFAQILEAVQYIHERGVVHRDLKPANVFLDRAGRVKVGDFGCSTELSRPGFVVPVLPVGTPGYIAPEILLSEGCDPRSDVFSLGCILYEMCQLKRPPQALSSQGRDRIPSRFTPALSNLVEAMMAADPKSRPTIRDILRMPIIRCSSPRASQVIAFGLPKLPVEKAEETGSINDEIWGRLAALKKKTKIERKAFSAVKDDVARQVGTKAFEKLRHHVINEFDDLGSAEFIQEYQEEHEDHVRLVRELVVLEQRAQ